METGAHSSGRRGGPAAGRAGDGEHDRKAGARAGRRRAGLHCPGAESGRENSDRPRDERQDVAAPATQQNVAVLKGRGAEFIGPEEGLLSCGYEGLGRLWPVEKVAGRALELLGYRVAPDGAAVCA